MMECTNNVGARRRRAIYRGGVYMSKLVSRREALCRIGKVSAAVALGGGIIRGQSTDIVVAGKPVEIAISSVSPSTVRISVVPLESGRPAAVPATGTIVRDGEGRAAGSGRTAGSL